MESVHVDRMVESGMERILTGLDAQNPSGNKALVRVVLQELVMNSARRAYLSAADFCRKEGAKESVEGATALSLMGVAEVLEKKAESFS